MESRINATNDSQFEHACTLASEIIHTPGLSILMVLIIVLGVLAITVNTFFCVSVWRVTLFHLNLRILFSHLALCSIWYCAAVIHKFSSTLLALLSGNSCSLVMTTRQCNLQDKFRALPSQALLYACACVTIERLYCTIHYQKPYKGFPVFSLVLVPCCYVPGLVNYLRSNIAMMDQYIPVCETLLSISVQSARSGLFTHIVFSLISLILIFLLHHLNHSHRRAMLSDRNKEHTLTGRFQLEQNIQVTRIIAPSAVLEVITFLPSLIFLFLVVVGLQLSIQTKTHLIQTTNLWKVFFCFAYPLVAFLRNAHLRRALLKSTPACIRNLIEKMSNKSLVKVMAISNKALDVKGTMAHFEMLEQTWNAQMK